MSSWIIDNVSIVSRNLGVKIGLKSKGSCDFLSDRSGVVRKGQKRSHFFHRLLLTWFSIFKGSSRKINWHASIYVVMNILCNNAEMAFRWKKKGLRDLKIYFLQWREKARMALIIVRRVLRQRKEAEKYDSLCHKSRAVKSTYSFWILFCFVDKLCYAMVWIWNSKIESRECVIVGVVVLPLSAFANYARKTGLSSTSS